MTLPCRRHLPLVCLVGTLVTVQASSSSHEYSFFNHNDGDLMYHRASVNVLDGIAGGEFSELYILYHGCV